MNAKYIVVYSRLWKVRDEDEWTQITEHCETVGEVRKLLNALEGYGDLIKDIDMYQRTTGKLVTHLRPVVRK
jgi:hypothetical protein